METHETLSREDLDVLREAKRRLEQPSLAAQLTQILGAPIEGAIAALPEKWSSAIATATDKALLQAITAAVKSLGRDPVDPHPRPSRTSNVTHKLLVAATGATGGAFGLAALAAELPLSTTVILRSIASVARNEGEPLSDLETQLACLSVFALGSNSSSDDASDAGYFALRGSLANAVTRAAKHLSSRGLTAQGSPALIRFISEISTRFGVVVSQKAAAQAIPVIGAAGAATINVLFIDHFQSVAQGHFSVRRLERKYGESSVRTAYEQL